MAAAFLLLSPPQAGAHVTAAGTRAACEREADGRGFTVLEAGDARDHRDGFSLAMRLRAHRGEVSTGTCFVDAATGNTSLYGFGWGDTSRTTGIRFSCASIETGRHECMLPVAGQAQLIERYSVAECVEGSSWGQGDGVVWVDKGCRAKFDVLLDADQRVASGVDAKLEGTELVCRSKGQYQECALGSGYTARLVEDLSGRCDNEADWGAREGLLWVNNGCSGRFERMRITAPIEKAAPTGQTRPTE